MKWLIVRTINAMIAGGEKWEDVKRIAKMWEESEALHDNAVFVRVCESADEIVNEFILINEVFIWDTGECEL